MVEKNKVLDSKVRHVGTFDLKDMYRILFEYFNDKGYEVNETLYKEIQQGGGLKEVDIFWDVTKNVSDYYKFYINVRFHPVAMGSTEVDIDGVKQKMNKGDLTMEFKSALIKDYSGKWDENSWGKKLRIMYDKYLVRERTEQHELRLIAEFEELIAYTKSNLLLLANR